MTLSTAEFICRFLVHFLPSGFHRIRYYGLLASATRADNIYRARRLLDLLAAQPEAGDDSRAEAGLAERLSPPLALAIGVEYALKGTAISGDQTRMGRAV
jgi:hypothetical protein